MRVLQKKTVLCFLAAIVLLTIALRYPLVEQERFQTDSYYIHILADSIVKDGHAAWTFHPLSYVGYYPFSYSSGVPFLLAEMSEMTGLRVELCILLMDMMLGVLFCLACFVIARQFLMRPEFVLLATLFAACAPRFVDTTYWDGSARGPLIVFLTLAVFAAYRGSRMEQTRLYAIAVVFGATTFALHHMAVLLVIFGVCYIIATFQARFLLPKILIRRRQAAASVNLLFIVGLLVATFYLFDYLTNPEETGMIESSLFNFDIPLLDILADLAVSYTSQIGFILPVAVIAILSVFRRSDFISSNIFLFAVLALFIPLLDRSLYVAMVLTPFVAILGTILIRNMDMYAKRRAVALLFVVILIAASIALPFWSSDRWNREKYISGDTVAVGHQDINDASYLRVAYPDSYGISNNNLGCMVLAANSRTGFFDAGIMMAINGDVNESNYLDFADWFQEDFPTNLYKPYVYENKAHLDATVRAVYINGMHGIHQNSSFSLGEFKTGKMLALVDADWPGSFVNQYNTGTAKLPGELLSAEWQEPAIPLTSGRIWPFESYKVYQSSGNTVYLFSIP